jgi:hypothetical protein
MLPRRHILDAWEFIKDKKDLASMATLTVAIDAIKHVDPKIKKDHLVEALELNEFICYMYPAMRPKNRSLLFHVVSDLLGLLLYGVPKKSKNALENIETINYSEKNIEIYPVVEVWNDLKDKVYRKKHGAPDVVAGFIRKIRIEMDIVERFPFVEELFVETKTRLNEWLPALSNYYDRKGKSIRDIFDKWWTLWSLNNDKDKFLADMVERLAHQAAREFDTDIDREKIFSAIRGEKQENRAENELFSRWYKEGVTYLLKI